MNDESRESKSSRFSPNNLAAAGIAGAIILLIVIIIVSVMGHT